MAALACGLLLGLHQPPQSRRELRVPEYLTGRRRLPARHVDLHASRVLAQRPAAGDSARHPIADGKAVGGHLDRGCQRLGERQAAPAVQQRVPGIHRAGDRRRKQRIIHWDLSALVLLVPVDGGKLGGRAFGIERDDLLRLGFVDQDDRVTADAVRGRCDECQNRLSGDRGVEGIPARTQHLLYHLAHPGVHRRRRIVSAADHRPHRNAARGFGTGLRRGLDHGENCQQKATEESSRSHLQQQYIPTAGELCE